jgi:hypothetical protein
VLDEALEGFVLLLEQSLLLENAFVGGAELDRLVLDGNLELLVEAAGIGVEALIGHGHRDLRGNGLESDDIIFVEGVELVAFDVQHGDELTFLEDRHR